MADDGFETRIHAEKTHGKNPVYMGVDLGGTSTDIGVCEMRGMKPKLLLSTHFQTKKMDALGPAIRESQNVCSEHSLNPRGLCIAAAGPITKSGTYCLLTNAGWSIDLKKIKKSTGIPQTLMINDFQALGWAVNILEKKDLLEIFPGKKNPGQPKAVLGAGTGLGKTVLHPEKTSGLYRPAPSEGGNSDFPVYDEKELEFIEYVKKTRKLKGPVRWDDIVSGRGIHAIYEYLGETGGHPENKISQKIRDSLEPAMKITENREADGRCRQTYRFFTRYFARCAKNYLIETMATGGVYLAGGIASRNPEIFKTREFEKEFHNIPKYSDTLESTPVKVITNYDASMLGACHALAANTN